MLGELGGAFVAQGFSVVFGGNSYRILSAGELGGGPVGLTILSASDNWIEKSGLD